MLGLLSLIMPQTTAVFYFYMGMLFWSNFVMAENRYLDDSDRHKNEIYLLSEVNWIFLTAEVP